MKTVELRIKTPADTSAIERALLKAAHAGHWHDAEVRIDGEEILVSYRDVLSLLAFAVAAGFCALLLWEADAFEYSFLKVARHDIRLRTEDVTGELAAFLKNGNLKAVCEYAEDSRHDGVRVTVFDATGKTLVDAGKPDRSLSARRKEFADTLANGEALTIHSTDVLGEYMLYSSRKVGD